MPARGVVEQQHARFGGQAHRDLELALAAVAERACDAVCQLRQAGSGERVVRDAAAGRAGGGASHSAHGRACAACAARRQFSKTLNSAKIVVRW